MNGPSKDGFFCLVGLDLTVRPQVFLDFYYGASRKRPVAVFF
jgi:hypothetical protein